MRKGVSEQSQCGALFTLIVSRVIYSLYLNGHYAVHCRIFYWFIIITEALISFILHFLLALISLILLKYILLFFTFALTFLSHFSLKVLISYIFLFLYFFDHFWLIYIVIFSMLCDSKHAIYIISHTRSTRSFACQENRRYGSVKSRSSESGAWSIRQKDAFHMADLK